MRQTKTLVIRNLHRLLNSRNGNPRWSFTDDDGNLYTTEHDAAAGYALSHSSEGKTMTVHYVKPGLVFRIDSDA